MIKARMTNEYLEVLAHGTLETWVKDTACNPDSKMIANYNKKRYDVENRKRVKVKELTDQGYKKR